MSSGGNSVCQNPFSRPQRSLTTGILAPPYCRSDAGNRDKRCRVPFQSCELSCRPAESGLRIAEFGPRGVEPVLTRVIHVQSDAERSQTRGAIRSGSLAPDNAPSAKGGVFRMVLAFYAAVLHISPRSLGSLSDRLQLAVGQPKNHLAWGPQSAHLRRPF